MKKKIAVYLLLLITVIFFIFSADESRRPLILTGDVLKRDAGTPDAASVSIGPDSGVTGRFLHTKNFLLNKGRYRIGVEYRADAQDNMLEVTDNGSGMFSEKLSPGLTYAEFPFFLDHDSQEIILHIGYAGAGTLSVSSVRLIPEGRFYNDAYYLAALVLLAGIALPFALRSRPVRSLSRKSRMILFLLAGIAVAASFPYLNGYLNWGDDICYHLTRIEGIKDGLLDGQLPVLIYPEGLRGNGYLNAMYPNLFLYLPALLRLGGVSPAASYKSLVLLFHFATAGITYLSVKSMCGSRKAALLASLLYTLCPYRLTNFYARGALGEALAMTFLPLLMAGLYHVLLGRKKNWWMLAAGMSGLIQTHVLSALIGAVFCALAGILYSLVLIREKRLLPIFKAAGLTVLLNLWFIAPFLYFFLKGNLNTAALDWCTFSEYSLNFSGLIGTLGAQDYRMLTLGLPVFLCAAAALFSLLFEKRTAARGRLGGYCVFLFVLGAFCVFMSVAQFPGWEFMNITVFELLLKNMQFAWRMLGPASALIIMSGSVLLFRSRFLREYGTGIFLALSGVCLLSATRYQAEDFAYRTYDSTYTTGHASKINGIPKGENTIVYPYEWVPEGANAADPPTELALNGPGAFNLMAWERNGTKSAVTYSLTGGGSSLVLPVIAYDGYRAFDETGAPFSLLENKDRLLELPLKNDGAVHEILVQYKGKGVFTAAFLISLAAAVLAATLPLYSRRKKRAVPPEAPVENSNENLSERNGKA